MSSSEDKDRRSHHRASLVLKVEYLSKRGFLKDYTANISRGGIMIRTGHALEPNEELSLVLSFPGLLADLKLRGTVRWVDRDGDEHTAGVEFDVGDTVAWQEVKQLVDRISCGDEAVVAPRLVRVLVVEDNPVVAELIQRGLAGHLHRTGDRDDGVALDIQHAKNGAEALSLLEGTTFDLMIADIFLPVLDGVELIRRMRNMSQFQTLPVIAVSAAGDETRDKALAAGADFFLSKPLRLSDLVSTMRRLTIVQHVPTAELPVAVG